MVYLHSFNVFEYKQNEHHKISVRGLFTNKFAKNDLEYRVRDFAIKAKTPTEIIIETLFI